MRRSASTGAAERRLGRDHPHARRTMVAATGLSLAASICWIAFALLLSVVIARVFVDGGALGSVDVLLLGMLGLADRPWRPAVGRRGRRPTRGGPTRHRPARTAGGRARRLGPDRGPGRADRRARLHGGGGDREPRPIRHALRPCAQPRRARPGPGGDRGRRARSLVGRDPADRRPGARAAARPDRTSRPRPRRTPRARAGLDERPLPRRPAGAADLEDVRAQRGTGGDDPGREPPAGFEHDGRPAHRVPDDARARVGSDRGHRARRDRDQRATDGRWARVRAGARCAAPHARVLPPAPAPVRRVPRGAFGSGRRRTRVRRRRHAGEDPRPGAGRRPPAAGADGRPVRRRRRDVRRGFADGPRRVLAPRSRTAERSHSSARRAPGRRPSPMSCCASSTPTGGS